MPKQQSAEFAIFTKLLAMATSREISENKVAYVPSSAPKALSYGKKIAKIGTVHPEIFDTRRS